MAAEGHRAHMQAQKAPSSSANRLAESLTANSHSSEEEGDSDGGVQLLLSHLHLEARPEVTMAARNRPRGGLTKDDPADAHEERNMWNQIVNDVNLRLKPLHARSTEVMKMIVEMESRIDSSTYIFTLFTLTKLNNCDTLLHPLLLLHLSQRPSSPASCEWTSGLTSLSNLLV